MGLLSPLNFIGQISVNTLLSEVDIKTGQLGTAFGVHLTLPTFDDLTITVYPTQLHAVWIQIVFKISTVP